MPELTIDQAIRFALHHHEAGRFAQAQEVYRQILAQHPNHPDALHLLGVLAHQAGRSDVAADLIQRAIIAKGDIAAYHCNLGEALRALHRLNEAVAAYSRAIALDPSFAQAYYNLAYTLNEQGKLDESIAFYSRTVEVDPNFAEAFNNLGLILIRRGRLDEAARSYARAVQLKPNYADAYLNLGIVLRDLGKLDEAAAAGCKAIELKPDYAEAHANLGTVLRDQGLIEEAIASYDRAIALRPDHAGFASNKVYALHFHGGYDASTILREHRRWNERHAAPLKSVIQPHRNLPEPGRRLNIGYISPDFRSHPVGRFMAPLLENHDHEQFQITCFSDVHISDGLTGRLHGHSDVWHDISGRSDENVTQLIRDERIDILVDLTMHMSGNRLLVFARKPAPVQVTYLAYCSTTGLDTIDYRLTDPHLDPPGLGDDIYSEQSVRLPETYWCYEPTNGAIEVGPLPALSRGQITFGCLNNFAKVSASTLDVWSRLLREFPNSRLLLHAKEGNHRTRVSQSLQRGGIDAARLNFIARLPESDYLRVYQDIDIALDPFPCAGGTTTCDALWMGVPVVSIAGRTAVGRSGVSILSNVGLTELIAPNESEYIRLATGLAADFPRLQRLRAGMRERMRQSPLMDVRRFARNVEAAYRQMWRKWCGT